MKVYHGSTQAVEYPLVGVGRENLDFGKGFSINVSLTSVSLSKTHSKSSAPIYSRIYNNKITCVYDRCISME